MLEEIKHWQSKFRALKDWKITVCHNAVVGNACCWEESRKRAKIYIWIGGEQPSDYVFHEMLHIAFSAIKNNVSSEEIFIQDVCNIFRELKAKETADVS